MNQSNHSPSPPSEPAWDITFTRIALAVRPQIEVFTLHLAQRFHALGLNSEVRARQTPRGQSVFLSLMTQRGLVCIVDLTLVDGMAVGTGAFATLDARLLDACGAVVAEGLANCVELRNARSCPSARLPPLENLDRAATAVYVAALAHFNLLRQHTDGR
jgi:hypothetical protein